MIRDALNALEATGFNFTEFDTDNDGYIDAIGFYIQDTGRNRNGVAPMPMALITLIEFGHTLMGFVFTPRRTMDKRRRKKCVHLSHQHQPFDVEYKRY
jgi:hypothetical protein